MNHKRLKAVAGFNQPVSGTNKKAENPMATMNALAKLAQMNAPAKPAQIRDYPAVVRLLACHHRRPADQRHGSGNSQALPRSH
jgi:hypothetical protein